MGTAAFDRPEDLWPRRWAEAYVDFAAGEKRSWLHATRPEILSRGRLGGARRRQCHRPRQFGATLPRHLGHWAGRARTVRPARARGREARADPLQVPPPGQRTDPDGRCRHRRARRYIGAERCRARQAKLARRRRRFRTQGAGGDRRLRRHRRQSRAGAEELAAAARRAAQAHDHRRSRPCRRSHAGDHRGRPAAISSTATACGTMSRASRTGRRSGPTMRSASCPARRRCGSTRAASACRCRSIPASTRWARSATS